MHATSYTTYCYVINRSVNNAKMEVFFKNDFTEDRWRKAALKNAFLLLGRQRFHHAAAFFLLAGSLKDAIEVRSWYSVVSASTARPPSSCSPAL